jgi:hypothetical protein
LIILNEEWEHRLYAERDLAALEAGLSPSGANGHTEHIGPPAG